MLQRLPMWIARHPRRAAAAATALLGGGLVTWALGGFQEAPPAPYPAYAAEATITTNEWHLRPLRAFLADRDPVGRRAPAGGAVLVMELHADNRTSRSSTSVTHALRLLSGGEDPNQDAVRQGTTPSLILLRDPSYGGTVHPGLPERVAAVWDLRPPFAAPTQARIRVIGREWVERDSLIGGNGWLRDRPVGELTMPVEDRRAPSAPAAGAGAPAAVAGAAPALPGGAAVPTPGAPVPTKGIAAPSASATPIRGAPLEGRQPASTPPPPAATPTSPTTPTTPTTPARTRPSPGGRTPADGGAR